MSQGRPSILAIVVGIFAVFSFLGLLGLTVMGWLLGKSFDMMIEQMLSDTGGLWIEAADIEEYEEPSPLDEPDEVAYEE